MVERAPTLPSSALQRASPVSLSSIPTPRAGPRLHQLAPLFASAILFMTTAALPAQITFLADASTISPTLPDAPGEPVQSSPGIPSAGAPATGAAPATPDTPKQTKRILGVLPNFRAVSAGTVLPPQTAKDKFTTGFEDSFDYSAFLFVGAQAAIAQGSNSFPAFHQGAAGYARYFWHTFADQADENLLVESIIPTLTHEDSRYYTLGRGGFAKRSVYAVSRAAITRSDHGGETVNLGEIVGAGAAAGISGIYYPDQYATWTKTGQRWLTNIVLDDALLYVKEFWPDINQALLHQKN